MMIILGIISDDIKVDDKPISDDINMYNTTIVPP